MRRRRRKRSFFARLKARLEGDGAQNAEAVESADAAAVIVQAGTADRPGAMLGAAFASLH